MALLATSSALPGLFHMLTLLLSSLVLIFLVCSIQASSKSVKTVSACGIASTQNWVNWMGSVETDFPLVFPKTDQELRDIVAAATEGGCKVRPVGTGHSY